MFPTSIRIHFKSLPWVIRLYMIQTQSCLLDFILLVSFFVLYPPSTQTICLINIYALSHLITFATPVPPAGEALPYLFTQLPPGLPNAFFPKAFLKYPLLKQNSHPNCHFLSHWDLEFASFFFNILIKNQDFSLSWATVHPQHLLRHLEIDVPFIKYIH